MVFRKGGFLGKYAKWSVGGALLEVVNEYNYLGFVFTTKLSMTKGVGTLALKGKRACIDCIKHISKLNDMSIKCYFKIVDTQVQPVLLYASEIWGLHRLDSIEKVHTLAIKRFLNVALKVPNKLVYGETGRYPLYINSAMRCIRYWLKLQTFQSTRLPRQAYVMLKNLDERGKKCWVTFIRTTFFSLGFGYVWLQQSVGNERLFLAKLKQRMCDIFVQEWDSSVNTKAIFQRYQQFKNAFGYEYYFEFLNVKCFRDCFIKLRLGVLPIGAPFFISVVKDTNNLCTLCNVMEDEDHFIFNCPLYANARQKYVNLNYRSCVSIIRNGSQSDIRRLSLFLFNALKTRDA
jgi:hypothetical protein